jgi:hypothetical protein
MMILGYIISIGGLVVMAAVKAGEPYIRVKKDNFAPVEFFATIEELDEVYPIPTFKQSNRRELKMLAAYKEELKLHPKRSPEKFLKTYYNA